VSDVIRWNNQFYFVKTDHCQRTRSITAGPAEPPWQTPSHNFVG